MQFLIDFVNITSRKTGKDGQIGNKKMAQRRWERNRERKMQEIREEEIKQRKKDDTKVP